MTTFPGAPRVLKGGIVLIDAETAVVKRIITLQYNPDTLTRSLQPQGVGGEGGDRSEALRLTGPPVETIKLEAEIDATDQLEFPADNETVVQVGLQAQLATLEMMLYPTSREIQNNERLARAGTLEIAPMTAPLSLFVWSQTRIVPVRITEFTVTEEAFDPALNPIRAKVSLGMRVLSVNDLGSGHTGHNLFMAYHQQKERLANMRTAGALDALGLKGAS